MFHPNAPSYCNTSVPSLYRRHEAQKKREYGDRVREVEQASFTPLVFATTGGMGREAIVFYRRLADHLSRRGSTSYSQTLAFIRCTLSFSLLRSATMCIRGSIGPSRIAPLMPFLRWAALMSTGTFKLLAIWSFLFSCPARAFFVLGVVGKGSPSSPGEKKKLLQSYILYPRFF